MNKKSIAGVIALVAGFAFATAAMAATYTFSVNLKQGSTGADVMNLQKALNMSADTQVSLSGAGAPEARLHTSVLQRKLQLSSSRTSTHQTFLHQLA